MLKTLDVSSQTTVSDIETLPGPVTFQQAIALLLR